MRPHYRLTRTFLLRLFQGLFGLRIEGGERVPIEGPLIICPNHGSYWDPPLIGVATPREIYYVAKEELFTTYSWFGWLIRKYNAIPIRRETGGLGAIRTTLDLLKQGKVVVIFPEGTRNKTGSVLLPLKAGAAIVAQMSGAPILPAYIKNNRRGMGFWMLRWGSPVVRFGNLLDPKDFPRDKKGTRLTEALEREMRKIAAALGVKDRS